MAFTAFSFFCLAGSTYLYHRKKTAREKLREELLAAQKRAAELEGLNELKTKLFAIVGHDLRSPIGNLRAMMELFQNRGMSLAEIADGLNEMLPSVENADLIICNLLNWAVNQMDSLKLNKSDFSFKTVADETISSFSFLLKSKQISIENTIALEPFVFADIDHIRIIVRNLLSNAIKFAPQKGHVRLGSVEKENAVVLTIEDNGKGLSADEIASIFSNKTHFTKAGSKGEKGAGIGLMLCQELACLNDGSILAKSVPGQHCTFFLNLPRSKRR